jgi:hypothetical protein
VTIYEYILRTSARLAPSYSILWLVPLSFFALLASLSSPAAANPEGSSHMNPIQARYVLSLITPEDASARRQCSASTLDEGCITLACMTQVPCAPLNVGYSIKHKSGNFPCSLRVPVHNSDLKKLPTFRFLQTFSGTQLHFRGILYHTCKFSTELFSESLMQFLFILTYVGGRYAVA